jgi:predicted dinucleotide-binding enzyme
MRIGILGAGHIGGTLGRLWCEAGHEICFGTRHAADVQPFVAELGPRARAGTSADAIAFGPIILLAVPLKATAQLGRDFGSQLAGKVVLDATNPYPERDGEPAHAARANEGGSGTWTAAQLPRAAVVKAFNTVYFKTLATEAHRKADRIGIPLAGDDASALETAAQLVTEAGFDPVIVGALARSREFDVGTPVYNSGMGAAALRRSLNVA